MPLTPRDKVIDVEMHAQVIPTFEVNFTVPIGIKDVNDTLNQWILLQFWK